MAFQPFSRGLRIAAAVIGLLAAVGLFTPASAAFPDKPITILVGYGPGGMTDVSSRVLAETLKKELGVDVIIENKPGAGGTLAWQALLKQPADGYTLVSFGSSAYVTSILLNRKVDLKHFDVLGSYMPQQRVLFARKNLPFKTLDGLVKYAKKTPVTFAGGGSYWAERVVQAMGKQFHLKLRIVPFRSGAAGSAAILGGHVDIAETGVGTSAWLAATQQGKLNILAVLSPGNLDAVGRPGVKSIADIGAKHLIQMYYGYAVRAGTPAKREKILSAALKKAVEAPKTKKMFSARDLIPAWIPGPKYEKLLSGLTTKAKDLKTYLGK